MVMQKYFSFFWILILLTLRLAAQTSSAPEITGERSMFSKVYLNANGDHEAVISPSPVHYRNNNAWEDISTMIVPDNANYKNESNLIRSYFPNSIDSSGKIKLIVNASDEILVHSEKKLVLLNNTAAPTVISSNPNNSTASVADNSIKYAGIYTNISDEFVIKNGEIKNNVVLNALPAQLSNVSSGYFGFQETLGLPAGWGLRSADSTVTADSLGAAPLLILDATGATVLTIPEPVFFDNYGAGSDGARPVEGKYVFHRENDTWTVTTLVPVQWLKDANTTYPVSLDPTVVIAGTTGGWQSPNNFVDGPGYVFVGTCCGNQTHRAWVKFNISSIPSTSCITKVEIQPVVTSVVANTAEVVLINDVTGAFGPYGAINAAAYADFGNGNYTTFTINGTGTYGYYTLGSSANSLLQSQLSGGWFEVAFEFSNEPSTDYKIMDGNSTDLRVTYTNPPCAVLPIELISFDAKCKDDKVNLTWETATQKDNDHFTIERTVDGVAYETIGTVAGAGTSSETLRYSFTDARPLKGTSYYSLRQTDINGQYKNFNLVSVQCDGVKETIIYPNPGAGTFIIEGAEPNSDLTVTDRIGQTILQTKISSEKMSIDLSRYPDGIYFIRTSSDKGSSYRKIVVSR